MARSRLLIRRRWLEVGALLLGAGLVPAIGYRLLGPPAPVLTISDETIAVEYFAPAAADALVLAGAVALIATSTVGLAEGRRRELHEARHDARKRQRLGGDSP